MLLESIGYKQLLLLLEEVNGSIPIRSTKTSDIKSETYEEDPSQGSSRIGAR